MVSESLITITALLSGLIVFWFIKSLVFARLGFQPLAGAVFRVAAFIFCAYILLGITAPMVAVELYYRFNLSPGWAGQFWTWISNDPSVTRLKGTADDVEYRGVISTAGAKRLEKELRQAGLNKTVYIHSGGGSTDAADRIISDVKEFKAYIYVKFQPSDNLSDCASACVNIFSSKADSRADSNARFMFHVPTIGFGYSFGYLADIIIVIAIAHDDSFKQTLLMKIPKSSEPKPLEQDKSYQRLAADQIDRNNGGTGRLERSIDSCPDHPFNTPKGITLTWHEILQVISSTSPIRCPERVG